MITGTVSILYPIWQSTINTSKKTFSKTFQQKLGRQFKGKKKSSRKTFSSSSLCAHCNFIYTEIREEEKSHINIEYWKAYQEDRKKLYSILFVYKNQTEIYVRRQTKRRKKKKLQQNLLFSLNLYVVCCTFSSGKKSQLTSCWGHFVIVEI